MSSARKLSPAITAQRHAKIAQHMHIKHASYGLGYTGTVWMIYGGETHGNAIATRRRAKQPTKSTPQLGTPVSE